MFGYSQGVIAALQVQPPFIRRFFGKDVTLEQIATKLFVTRNTVKSQVRSVYRKIGVSNRAEAVAWARQAGLGVG